MRRLSIILGIASLAFASLIIAPAPRALAAPGPVATEGCSAVGANFSISAAAHEFRSARLTGFIAGDTITFQITRGLVGGDGARFELFDTVGARLVVDGGSAATSTVVYTVLGHYDYALSLSLDSIDQSISVSASCVAAPSISPQTITFNRPADTTYGTGPVTLSATATSGLGVSFLSATTGVCTVSGNIATLVSVGTCTITASQAGNANYAAAPDSIQSFQSLGTPGIGLTAVATPAMFAGVGQRIDLVYTVRNFGNVPVTGLAVIDTRVSGVTCLATSLAAGAITTCRGSTISTANDIVARVITSSAIARASYGATPLATGTVVTPIGIDVTAIQRATTSAIQGLLSNRASFLTSNGPDTYRRHSRLGGGLLFGGDTGDYAQTEGTPSGFAPSPFASAGATRNGGLGGLAGSLGFGTSTGPVITGRPTFGDGFGSAFGRTAGMPGDPMSDDRLGDRQGGAPEGPLRFSGFADDGIGRYAFATSLSQMQASAAAADQAKLSEASGGPAASGHGLSGSGLAGSGLAGSGLAGSGLAESGLVGRAPGRTGSVDVWVEGIASYVTNKRIDGTRVGQAAVTYAGVDYVVMPGLLVGIMGQMDWMSENSSTLGQNRDGRGWMAGPYLSARLTPNLYFDTRAAWGYSTNQIDPIGAYVDTFATSRALTSAKLTGDWNYGAFRFRPSAEVVYFTETAKEYINAINIAIPGQTFSLGRTVFGPEVGYQLKLADQSTLEPFVAFKGVWDFSRTAETAAGGEPIKADDIRGRAEVGMTYRMPAGIWLRATGAYDGVGGSGYHAVQGQAKLVVPLQ